MCSRKNKARSRNFGVKLFECNLALDRTAEAHAVLDRLHRQKKQYAVEAVEEIKQWKKEREDSTPEDLTRDEHRRLNKLRRRAKTSPTAFAYLHGSLLHAEKNSARHWSFSENPKRSRYTIDRVCTRRWVTATSRNDVTEMRSFSLNGFWKLTQSTPSRI